MAFGNIGGIPKIRERRIGATNPTANPHGPPQKKPHNNTGMCIGQSIEPISGICPVKNGITIANAKNIADKVKFLMLVLYILLIYHSTVCTYGQNHMDMDRYVQPSYLQQLFLISSVLNKEPSVFLYQKYHPTLEVHKAILH